MDDWIDLDSEALNLAVLEEQHGEKSVDWVITARALEEERATRTALAPVVALATRQPRRRATDELRAA